MNLEKFESVPLVDSQVNYAHSKKVVLNKEKSFFTRRVKHGHGTSYYIAWWFSEYVWRARMI